MVVAAPRVAGHATGGGVVGPLGGFLVVVAAHEDHRSASAEDLLGRELGLRVPREVVHRAVHPGGDPALVIGVGRGGVYRGAGWSRVTGGGGDAEQLQPLGLEQTRDLRLDAREVVLPGYHSGSSI